MWNVILELVVGWLMVVCVTGFVFPHVRRLHLLRDDFMRSSLWVFVPSVCMWWIFFRNHPTIFGGIMAFVGLAVGVWMWKTGDRVEETDLEESAITYKNE